MKGQIEANISYCNHLVCSNNVIQHIFQYTGCIKKTEQILNRSQRREAAQSMKFLINIDCLGTYDVE